MPTLHRLPTAQDGAEGLKTLVDLFGEENVFMFIGWIRDPAPGPVTTTRQVLAVTLLRELMASNPALDYEHARRTLAKRLGYNALNRTNLYKLIEVGEQILHERQAGRAS